MLRFYTKERISREVHSINLSREEAEIILEGNLFKDCPQYNDSNVVIIERDTNMGSPTWDNNELREMTREEEILILNLTEKLIDGEYIQDGRVVKIEYDTSLGYLKPTWDKGEHVWYEGATEEELQEKYYSIINTSKAEILENGYLFIDNSDGKHQQKCRDKDLALLGNCIAAHEDATNFSPEGALTTLWAFNDGDALEMTLPELKKLRLQGAMFVQTIFNVEAQLKTQESNIKFTKADFIELINSNSDIKCWQELSQI